MMDLLCKIVDQVLNPIVLLLAAAAFVVFLWGLVKFLSTTAQGGEMAEGKNHMLWGIVGLIIIFGAYGLINIVITTFGIDPLRPSCQQMTPPPDDVIVIPA
jgi:phosphate starvation-inducible membrane PsiE